MKTASTLSGVVSACLIVLLLVTPLLADKKLNERIENSKETYEQLINAPDRGVPEGLLKDARCIAVLPGVKKGAFVFGGRHGKGVVSCRKDGGGWSALGFLTLSGGSFGFQIGGSSTDVVLFIMSEKGAKSLVKSEFTLGADASVAGGPVGRTAEASTDYRLEADILSYARAKGLFAGVALDGASLRSDQKAHDKFYGDKIPLKKIIFEDEVPVRPAVMKQFLGVLP